MEEFIDIELNECILCHESYDKLIKYEHKCGIYYIHKKCLLLWFKKHNNECIICRNKLNPEIKNNADKKFCFYIIILFTLFILFLIVLLFFLILF